MAICHRERERNAVGCTTTPVKVCRRCTGDAVRLRGGTFRPELRGVSHPRATRSSDEKGNWNAWRYPDGQIDIVKTYVSRQGEWLAMLRVLGPPRSNADGCDVVLGEEHDVQLFHLEATGKAKHLGASLTVVDAGDYDGDGKSEVVTMFQRDNYDGYTLFYDGFRRQVSFGWHYH